jgi:hypothetical protein
MCKRSRRPILNSFFNFLAKTNKLNKLSLKSLTLVESIFVSADNRVELISQIQILKWYHFFNLSSTTHLRSSPKSRDPSQRTTSLVYRNVRHRNDEYLLRQSLNVINASRVLAQGRGLYILLSCGYIFLTIKTFVSHFYWLERRSAYKYKTALSFTRMEWTLDKVDSDQGKIRVSCKILLDHLLIRISYKILLDHLLSNF